LTAATLPPAIRPLQTSGRRRTVDRLARFVLTSGAVTTFVITLLIIGTLGFDAWKFVAGVTLAERGQGWQLAIVVAAAIVGGALMAKLGGRLLTRATPLAKRIARPLIAVLIAIIGISIVGGWRTFNRLGDHITDRGWYPRRELFDIGTLIIGTLIVVFVAMIVALPLGLGAAVYLSEYARPRIRRIVKPVLEILAGIPSVVLAYFALSFINPEIVVRFFDPRDRAFSMLAAGLAVGVLTVPIIASVAEDALRAVPDSLREASFGIGAKRSQTTFRVVFPAGISGIVAAFILGVSRAIGETMVVALAAGAVGGALFHFNPVLPGQTMTAAMAALGFGSDQVAGGSNAFQSLYFIGALLFLMTLVLNILGDKLVSRVREVY
jgi:phosphate transport system permease protein